MIVVDTNIISYLFIKGNYTKQVKETLKKDPNWISSILWRSEFRSVLSLYLRKQHINLQQAKFLMQEAEYFMSGSEYQVDSNQILELIQHSNCSAYDCEFVVLAKELNIPLITSDKQILKAFPEIALSLNQFLNR